MPRPIRASCPMRRRASARPRICRRASSKRWPASRWCMCPIAGAQPALTDVMAGNVDMFFDTPTTSVPLYRNRMLKILAVADLKRTPALPEVPTFSEAGLPGFRSITWFGLVAPPGTPAALADRINHDVVDVLEQPGCRRQAARPLARPRRHHARRHRQVLRRGNRALEQGDQAGQDRAAVVCSARTPLQSAVRMRRARPVLRTSPQQPRLAIGPQRRRGAAERRRIRAPRGPASAAVRTTPAVPANSGLMRPSSSAFAITAPTTSRTTGLGHARVGGQHVHHGELRARPARGRGSRACASRWRDSTGTACITVSIWPAA